MTALELLFPGPGVGSEIYSAGVAIPGLLEGKGMVIYKTKVVQSDWDHVGPGLNLILGCFSEALSEDRI